VRDMAEKQHLTTLPAGPSVYATSSGLEDEVRNAAYCVAVEETRMRRACVVVVAGDGGRADTLSLVLRGVVGGVFDIVEALRADGGGCRLDFSVGIVAVREGELQRGGKCGMAVDEDEDRWRRLVDALDAMAFLGVAVEEGVRNPACAHVHVVFRFRIFHCVR